MAVKKRKKTRKPAAKKRAVKRAKKAVVKKVARKKTRVKKSVVEIVKKPVRKIKRKAVSIMARRKSRRSGSAGYGKKDFKTTAIDGAMVAAGAVGAGVAANYLPIPDARIKAAIPVAAGVLLASTKFGTGKAMNHIALGMVAMGALSLMRQFLPNVPMMAGEDSVYVPDYSEQSAMLGDDGLEYMGAPMELGYEDEPDEMDGDELEIMGGQSEVPFITSADL